LRRHLDEKERSPNKCIWMNVVVVSCGSDQKTWTGLELEFIG
jgi:hypothetical protein